MFQMALWNIFDVFQKKGATTDIEIEVKNIVVDTLTIAANNGPSQTAC